MSKLSMPLTLEYASPSRQPIRKTRWAIYVSLSGFLFLLLTVSMPVALAGASVAWIIAIVQGIIELQRRGDEHANSSVMAIVLAIVPLMMSAIFLVAIFLSSVTR